MSKARNNSRKNSNIDSCTQPCSFTSKQRFLENQVNSDNKPKISDPSLTTDDSNLSEDEEPVYTETKDLKLARSSIRSTLCTPTKQQQNVSSLNYFKLKHIFIFLIILGIFLIILGIFLLPRFIFKVETSKNIGNDVIPGLINPLSNLAMDDLLDEMQNSFPLQKEDTWISFLSALSSVVEQEEPSQPAVLLFVGVNTQISTHTMHCVALTLANNTNKLLPAMNSANTDSLEVIVQVDKFLNLQNQEEIIKRELDTRIRSILNKSYSIIVGPLEKIPPEAALLLHGYCDNFEAPFKKRVIILTATFDSDKPLNSKQLERKLHRLWDPQLGKDKSGSLVSRIANNVVYIEPEIGSIPCTI